MRTGENDVNYRKVLVPLDGSTLAESVLPHLEALASNCQVTSVELVRVVPQIEVHHRAEVPISGKQEKQLNADAMKEAEEYLMGIKSRLDSSRMTVGVKVLAGRVADVLAEYLEASDADLIILATHGRSGPSRWLWGSIADRLLRISRIPVFLVRPPGCKPGL
jgi:nucleotide-binding universal stress UspA family protein